MQFIIAFFPSTLLFGQNISQKLILSADKNSTSAQMHLLKLKIIFIENEQTRALQEKYNFTFMLETLDEYTMLVIKPIKSQSVKNELVLLLSAHFPNMFSICANTVSLQLEGQKKADIVSPEFKENNVLNYTDELMKIGLQWIALLLLSMVGLILSVNGRRKMASLETMQIDLSRKQDEIEKKIKHLGATGV